MRCALLIAIAAVGFITRQDARAAAVGTDPAPAGVAASSDAQSSAEHKSDVLIRAQRAQLESRVSTFVKQVTDFQFGDPSHGLARWREAICPLVSGVARAQGDYILARVAEIARLAGAPLAGKQCRPNLLVVVSATPRKLLQDIVKSHRTQIFGDAAPSAIDPFINSPRAVRTWYDTETLTPDGLPMLHTSFPGITTGQTVTSLPGGGIEIDPVNSSGNSAPSFTANTRSVPSRLMLNAVWAIDRVFMVVDATQLHGTSLGQLADYVTVAGLAQIRLDADLGDAPTILTLFDGRPGPAPPGMTDWDRAFLKAVYSTSQKSILQRSAIAHDMVYQIGR